MGAFMYAPYLDMYGETDENLRRGLPLRLVRDRYDEIRFSWIQNSLNSTIFRKNEASDESNYCKRKMKCDCRVIFDLEISRTIELRERDEKSRRLTGE